MELPVLNRDLEAVDQVPVAEAIATAPRKTYVVWEAVRHELARRRRGTHSTKTRGEVRGGGRKPWVQKGTGRARHGSIRSPLWVGGGVAHGPKPRDYDYPFPKKKKKLAWRIVLADRIREDRVRVLDSLTMEEPRTKAGIAFIEKLQLRPGQDKILFIDVEPDRNFELSVRNIPKTRVLPVKALTIYELLHPDILVFTRQAFETFQRMCEP